MERRGAALPKAAAFQPARCHHSGPPSQRHVPRGSSGYNLRVSQHRDAAELHPRHCFRHRSQPAPHLSEWDKWPIIRLVICFFPRVTA